MKPISKSDLAHFEGLSGESVVESNFALAFMFLPKSKRTAITSIYTFCSYIDDIIDSSDNLRPEEIIQKEKRIGFWKETISNIYYGGNLDDEIIPLAWAIKEYNIPISEFEILINGISIDLRKRQYSTIDEMLEYCYGVASIVGQICLNIFGDTSDNAVKYAISLGYALQITNIMRDVSADKNRKYRYIPTELFDKYHYTDADFDTEIYNSQFIAIMKELGGLAESYYLKAENYLAQVADNRIMLASEIMKNTYHAILEKIISKNYNVFSENRIKLSKMEKIGIAIRTILRSTRNSAFPAKYY